MSTRRIASCLPSALMLVLSGSLTGTSIAACMAPEARFNVHADVRQCTAQTVAGIAVLQLQVVNVRAEATDLAGARLHPVAVSNLQARLDQYRDTTMFFTKQWPSTDCAAFLRDGLHAGIELLCCDTVPAEGECLLDAPLVNPKDAEPAAAGSQPAQT